MSRWPQLTLTRRVIDNEVVEGLSDGLGPWSVDTSKPPQHCKLVVAKWPIHVQGSGHGACQIGGLSRLSCMFAVVWTLFLASGASQLM